MFWAAIVAKWAIIIFLILSILVFFVTFKYHVKLTVAEYYLWGKQYDIPLALFSINMNGDSSVVALNKIYYGDNSLKENLREILDKWFGKVYYYKLSFGSTNIVRENASVIVENGNWYIIYPTGTRERIKVMKIMGEYPLPIVGEIPNVIELNYSTLIPQ